MATRYYGCLLILACCVAVAQASDRNPAFALEIRGSDVHTPNTYLNVADGGSTTYYDGSLQRLPGRDPNAPEPSALTLSYKLAGDELSITATVFYGKYEYDRQAKTVWLGKLPHQIAATGSGRLNDVVTLSALKEVGLKPLMFRIVAAQPEHPYHPGTQSKAPSLQFEYAPVDRHFGTLIIHNSSKKAVTAFSLDNGAGAGEGRETRGLGELVGPGETAKIDIQAPTWGWNRQGNYIYSSEPPPLILEAALFADGSYEGDEKKAQPLLARGIGASVQWQRIETYVEPLIAEAGSNSAGSNSNDEAKIKRIRAFVSQLADEPDPKMVADFLAQFPDLSDHQRPWAKSLIASGMHNEKIRVDTMALNFEQDLEANVTLRPTLAAWGPTVRGK